MSQHPERKKSWWQKCCSCTWGEDLEDSDKGESPGEILPGSVFALEVQSVDLMKQRTGETRKAHHTDEFEYDELIVRRGQPFQVCVTFQRPFNAKSDQICVLLQMGNMQPITLPQVREFDEGNWGCQVDSPSGSKVTLWLNTSTQALVGKYQLCVKTQSPGGSYTQPSNPTLRLYVLFNAWCHMDAVFLDNESWRQEYVLNEIGRIYYGTKDQIGDRSWNYGQFEKGIMDAVFFLLDRGGLSPTARGDPIRVSRVISAMVNSLDNNGVIVGKWSKKYDDDGVNPLAWVGSVDILRQYHQTGTSVKYGQCWVFGGVTTTVLRCLGIPVRTTTNFESAHDTDKNLTMDMYFDENMKLLKKETTDSIWNYHVWNECWMTRPDLPSGYSGWQAIDATPQEKSTDDNDDNGKFCCGPSPLLAIKNGLVNLKHDTPFIFAEVNSDKVFYQRMPNGKFKQIGVDEHAVGHCISTKAVGSNKREDITYLYKYPEGSAEERNAVRKAAHYGNIKLAVAAPEATSDVSLGIKSQDNIIIGSDINVRVTVKNGSNSRRTVSLSMCVAAMFYNGVCKDSFKEETLEVSLNPGEDKAVGMLVRYSEYQAHVVDQGAMIITVSGTVRETGQKLAKQHMFRTRTPDLIIKVLGNAIVGQQIVAEILFKNPLQTTLHKAAFHVEGPSLQRPKVIPVGDIGPLKSVSITERFTPRRPGPRQLIASLESNELGQVHGFTEIIVRDS